MRKVFTCIVLFCLAQLAIGCGGRTYDGSEKFYDSGMNQQYTTTPPNYIPDGEHDTNGNLLP